MTAVYQGRLEDADKILSSSGLEKKKKDILLYYFNRGTVYWMMGNFQESNKYFQLADYYIEDYKKNYAAKALSFISNPKVEPYPGEGFEHILVHYYTTLNYAQLGNYESALVECKRMLLKLQKITDTYGGKNKYKRDAFVHNLMGMIYDAQKDYNNAFIAYRNALEIYEEDYVKMLQTSTPVQLKKDLIRTAYLTGFYEEGKQYEEKFKLKYEKENPNNGSLVFFWNNGLGPVKDEWSINFAIIPAGNGMVHFVNTELGIIIPFYIGNSQQSNSLTGLKVIRVAFPKYVSRLPLYQSASYKIDSLNLSGHFETGENIDAIAYRSLEDRMLKELGEALLRLALKQVAEQQVRKENQGLGMALSLVNAISEQADTRNWQLLPYAIHYTRVSLPPGRQHFVLQTHGEKTAMDTTNFEFTISKGQTTIGTFQSLQFTGYK
ncbi:MAG: hypothetical protein V4590_04585 [Bacteroidota bacterium]